MVSYDNITVFYKSPSIHEDKRETEDPLKYFRNKMEKINNINPFKLPNEYILKIYLTSIKKENLKKCTLTYSKIAYLKANTLHLLHMLLIIVTSGVVEMS